MGNFDLDSMKDSWKKQNEIRYERQDIEKILKKRSVTNIGFIFWISFAEFLVCFGFFLYSWYSGELFRPGTYFDSSNVSAVNDENRLYSVSDFIISVLEILIPLYFVYKFYRSYREVKIQSSLKKLTESIFNLRKTVRQYVWANFALILLWIGISYIALETIVEFKDRNVYRKELLAMTISCVILLGVVWLYFRLVYGTLTRRLKKIQQQLAESDAV